MLAIESLTGRYTRLAEPALRELSLSVAAGERVALVGSSGSGKATLFRAISGFVPVAAGRIVIAGTDITRTHGRDLRALRRGIGVIAQQHDLVDRLRVYQNVMAGELKERLSESCGGNRLSAPTPATADADRTAGLRLQRAGRGHGPPRSRDSARGNELASR